LRVACGFLFAFVMFLLCLGWVQEAERAAAGGSDAVGSSEVSSFGDVAGSGDVVGDSGGDDGAVALDLEPSLVSPDGSDPLGLVYPGSGFEFVGLAGGGSVMGYGCPYPPEQASLLITGELGKQGWVPDSAEGALVVGFTRGQDSGLAGGYLLVQCVVVPGGSSVVIQRM
jgi:hypothetical protein